MKPSSRRHAVILIVLASVLWSLGGVLIKWVDWHPLAISGARSTVAALVLLIYIRRPVFTWGFLQLGGAVSYAAVVICFVAATRLTTAANAILLQYTAPAYIALFSAWFLKERITSADWVTILLVLGGISLFFLDDLTFRNLWGNFFGILLGISFAWLTLFLRRQKNVSNLESILLGNIIAALIGVPFMFERMPDVSGWTGIFLLGTVQLGLPYILYSSALKHTSAIEASLIPAIEPVLNPLWVWFLLGEVPGKYACLGGIVILAALLLRAMIVRPHQSVPAKLEDSPRPSLPMAR